MKKIVIVNTFIFFFLLFFLEFSIRILNVVNILGHDENLYSFNTTPRSLNPDIESIAFGKKIFTDSHGFRVPNKDYKYDNLKKSILIIGDSVTFGLGVKEEESVIGILRSENTEFNFYNTSVSGHNLKSYKEVLSKHINTLKFEKVIIFLGLNDIYYQEGILKKISSENLTNNKKSFVQTLKEKSSAVKINNYLRSRSALYILIKSLITNPQKRYFDTAYPMYLNNNNLNLYEQTIREIKKLTEKNKKLIFILLPFEFQTRKINCNQKNLKPQKIIKNILIKNELNYFDFSQDFCKHQLPKSLYLKYDPAHLSVKGHNFLKKLIDNKKNIIQLD